MTDLFFGLISVPTESVVPVVFTAGFFTMMALDVAITKLKRRYNV